MNLSNEYQEKFLSDLIDPDILVCHKHVVGLWTIVQVFDFRSVGLYTGCHGGEYAE